MANLASLPSYRHGRIEVDSLAELEAHLGGSPPKLMVVDEALLNTAAVPLLSRLERQAPGLPWIVAWDDPSERSFGLAMTFRARGCIDWHCGADHLHRALVAVLGGDIWFPRRMLQTLYLASISKQHDAATQPGSVVQQRMQAASVAGEPLTKREAETLTLIREGFSNKQISARLGISVSTVKKHVELTFEKCGLRHRRQTLA